MIRKINLRDSDKNWYITSQVKVKKVQNDLFEIYKDGKKIGQAYVDRSPSTYGRWILQAIDIDEEFQRQGYGTILLQNIVEELRRLGAKELSTSNEGSGTVQLLEKVFGPGRVKHFQRGEEISKDEAIKIMDVDFGYTKSVAYF